MNRRIFLQKTGLAGGVFLAGTPFILLDTETPPDLVRVERVYVSMGTAVRFLVFHEDGKEALAAIHEAQALVQRVHRLMSVQEPESELSRWNRSEVGLDAPFDPLTIGALTEACYYSEVTGGRFDPTVGTAASGYQGTSRSSVRPDRLDGLDAANGRFEKSHPGVRLDLGGSAKGWAVDRAMEILMRRGVGSALVNAGGDLRVAGHPPDAAAWRIGIRNPVDADRTYCELKVTGCSIATSGGYEPQGSNIIDPRDRRPVRFVGSATVVAPTCGAADCLSTALCVEADFRAFGPDTNFLVARPDDGGLTVGHSPDFPTSVLTRGELPGESIRFQPLSGR